MKSHHSNVIAVLFSLVFVLAMVPLMGHAQDDNTLDIVLTPSSVSMNERSTASYSVRLSEEPNSDVTLSLSISNNEEISPERFLLNFAGSNNDLTQTKTLTFTTQDWDQKQTVSLASDIDEDFANETLFINHLIINHADYSALKTLSVNMNDIGNDEPEIIVSKSSITVQEGSIDDSGDPSSTMQGSLYTVKLSKQPSENINVELTSDNSETVTLTGGTSDLLVIDSVPSSSSKPLVLLFTAENWEQEKTIVLRSPEDDDGENESIKITHSAEYASGRTSYIQDKEVTVTLNDNDKDVSLIIVPSEQLVVGEGNRNSYNVKLSDQPDSDVTVRISSSDPSILTVENPTLTFTRSNWNRFKSVTVSAKHDNDNYNEDVILTHNSQGGGYDRVDNVILNVFVDDDDLSNPQLIITPNNNFIVKENKQTSYTVRLSEQPNSNVVVSITSSNVSALIVQRSLLTFTTENWDQHQTVNVTGRQDSDNANEEVNITHNSRGGGYDDVDNVVLEAIVDDDEPLNPALEIAPSDQLVVNEGNSSFYNVRLTEKPGASVTIDLISSDASLLTVSNRTLTFTTESWNTFQTVSVTAKEDVDNDNEELNVIHNSRGGGYDDVDNVVLNVFIDDSGPENPHLITNPSSFEGDNAIDEDQSFDYTLRLSERPIGDVTVTLVSNDTDVLRVNRSTSTLIFTTEDWNVPQQVEAIASDYDSINDTVSIAHSASGGGYNGVRFNLRIEVTDNDAPELIFNPSNEIIVDEGGSTNYQVSLSTKPTSTVTVSISAEYENLNQDDLTIIGDINFNKDSLTFTSSNWNRPQTVTVSAIQDNDADDIESLIIRHQAEGGEYEGLSRDLKALVNDDEAEDISLIVTPSQIGPLTEGESLTYGVRLNANPTTFVNLAITHTDDISIITRTSGFDASSWNVTQQIEIMAVEDQDLDDERITINHSLSATGIVGLNGKNVELTIKDDEPSNPEILIQKRLMVIEEGGDQTYVVRLSERPSDDDDVSIGLNLISLTTEGHSVTILPNILTFTRQDWNVPQEVTVSNLDDLDGTSEILLINHTGRGGGYQHASPVEVRIVIDDDEPTNPQVLTSARSPLNIREGESATYTIRLSERPSEEVRVNAALTSYDPFKLSLNPSSLTFTTENWRNAQTVEITALQDRNSNSESVTLTHVGTGGGYDSAEQAIIQINVTDDDPTNPEIILSSPEIMPSESADPSMVVEEGGDAASYKVKLSQKPSGDVNVTLTRGSANIISIEEEGEIVQVDQLNISPKTLEFGVLNWNIEQTVTLRALNNDHKDNLTSSVIHTATGGGYLDVGNDFIQETLEVTLKNDDPRNPRILLSTVRTIVEEGQAQIYMVTLNEQPSRDNESTVVVSLTSDNPDVSIFPESLAFTRQNWNVNQTVQIFAKHDSDAEVSNAAITHSAEGAGYDNVRSELSVEIEEDDPTDPKIRLTKQLLALNEGEYESYNVELSQRPSAQVTIAITSDNPDVTVDSPTLTFTRLNWSHPQTVMVSAANDQGGIDDSANLTNNATGGGYDGQTEIVRVIVRDDEPSSPSLILSSFPSISINENGNTSYQIKLSERPVSNVTVTLGIEGSEIIPNPRRLSFTPLNWRQPQQINLSAQDDPDIDDEQINLTHTVTGGGYDGVNATLTIDLIDDDSVGLKITPVSNFVVPEGESSTYTVELKTLPESSVRVSLSTNTEKVQLSTTTLDFRTSNWDVPQTVRVTAKHDEDEVDDEFIIIHDSTSQDSDYDNVDGVHLVAEINDDEVEDATLRITPSSLRMNEHETLTYSVQLNKMPTGDVTVNIANQDISKMSVQPESLGFTTSDWNLSQNITVTALADADGNDESISILHYSNGGGYDQVRNTLEVTITDDEPENPEIVIPSELDVSEGQTGTYSVRLNEKPSGNVSVTIIVQDLSKASVDKSTLSFTSSNWESPQIVRVTAEQDDDAEEESLKILHTANGGGFESAEVVELSLSIEDDEPDAPSIVLDGLLSVVEGESGTYEIKLGEEPSETVVVSLNVSGSSDVSVDDSSLTFTSSNWNVLQTVRVIVADDEDNVDGTAQIVHAASGGGYDGVQKTLDVVVEDDEPDAPSIVLDGLLSVVEGESGTYEIKLGEEPSETVVVSLNVSGSSDVSVDDSSLTFTSSNWNVSQTVRVTVVDDEDNVDGTAQIVHAASGGGYDGVQKTLDVVVEDDEPDAPSIVLDGLLSVVEGESGTYEIKLGEEPSETVVVSLNVSGSSDVSVDDSSLTFTSSNWNVSQTVRVTTTQDDDNEDDSAQITHNASGGGYDGVQKTLDVEVRDDELKNPELVANPSELTIVEGHSSSYSVMLSEMPKGDVSVSITSNRGTVTLNDSDLQFTQSNWNKSQKIMVSVSEDNDGDDDVALLRHRLNGGDYDGITKNLMVNVIDSGAPQAPVVGQLEISSERQTVEDAGIQVSRNSLDIDEGEQRTYKARLTSAPLDTVTLRIRSSNSEVDVDPRTLTFTTSDWNDYQTVEVSADHDDDTSDEDGTLTHVASGGGYDNAKEVEIDVEVDDDDTESETSSDEESSSESLSSLELPRFKSTSEIAAQTSSSWPRWNTGSNYQTNLENRNVLINDISFNAFRSSVDPIAFIARLSSRPRLVSSDPPGIDSVYGFFEIALNDAAKNTASSATVSFMVDDQWLSLRDFTAEGVQLWGWDESSGSWRNFNINSVTQRSKGLSFSSDISLRMSFFAITATSVEVEEQQPEEEPESKTVEVVEVPSVVETVQPAEEQPSYFDDHPFEFELSPMPIVITLVLLVVGFVALIFLLRL